MSGELSGGSFLRGGLSLRAVRWLLTVVAVVIISGLVLSVLRGGGILGSDPLDERCIAAREIVSKVVSGDHYLDEKFTLALGELPTCGSKEHERIVNEMLQPFWATVPTVTLPAGLNPPPEIVVSSASTTPVDRHGPG